MSNSDLKDKIVNIISNHKTGILASVENNKPHLRYMTFYHEALTLYTPTERESEKIEEIENNPYVSVLLGYEDKGHSDAYVEILGTSSINDTQALKDQFWEESFSKWFDGPNDPNYVFLEIKPQTVRVLNLNGEPPQELSLENN
ncbi:pyridoxamine 5'-phosphate oxidase family protein [Lederbergia citrea]|uniref:Pyridoxamine 5'-phosphate oxidase family protein n=1 Tax=Lederbergia citrea TaxID=2833581 RepID=A0A942Z5U9_9BACI|nr:pyridoxamine 5'-phosphate oxidase family protein [Lederbergia citrea]MBS4177661.1 pyridoxamine 5'-phosphate oxidase family protein [Lederbergia citrea]MBS4204341.1 pyridoxamine 5'-phosphate oxidase family protein [Lederbergia citrea]MBS4223815.1 pyridoxamine 5'-phosphate oxidase family protein [Lederbergia citrea]